MTGADDTGHHDQDELGKIVTKLRVVDEKKIPCVRDFVQELGPASLGALLLVPSLIIASPASAIPGLPSIGGLIIALISVQMLFGRDHVWLPDWVMSLQLNGDRIDRALELTRRPVNWVDHLTRTRLTWILRRPTLMLLQLLCALSGLAMPFMEMLPLASSVGATAVFLVALGIITDDGLLALAGVGIALAGGAVFLKLAGSVVSGVF